MGEIDNEGEGEALISLLAFAMITSVGVVCTVSRLSPLVGEIKSEEESEKDCAEPDSTDVVGVIGSSDVGERDGD